MAVISHVKWDYPIKKALYPLSLLLGVPNVKTTDTKSRPESIFQLLTFTFDPFFNVKWVTLLQRPYVSFSSPLLLILRRGITAAVVALYILLSNRGTFIDTSIHKHYSFRIFSLLFNVIIFLLNCLF